MSNSLSSFTIFALSSYLWWFVFTFLTHGYIEFCVRKFKEQNYTSPTTIHLFDSVSHIKTPVTIWETFTFIYLLHVIMLSIYISSIYYFSFQFLPLYHKVAFSHFPLNLYIYCNIVQQINRCIKNFILHQQLWKV